MLKRRRRILFESFVMLAALIILSALHSGCSTIPLPNVQNALVDAGGCALGDASALSTAIQDSTTDNWVSFALRLAQCIPQVIRDLEAAPPTATRLASVAPPVMTLPQGPLSLETRRRVRAIKIIYKGYFREGGKV